MYQVRQELTINIPNFNDVYSKKILWPWKITWYTFYYNRFFFYKPYGEIVVYVASISLVVSDEGLCITSWRFSTKLMS